jgi:hypothetical protein
MAALADLDDGEPDLDLDGFPGLTPGGGGNPTPGHLDMTGSVLVDRTHGENFNVSGFMDYLVGLGWTVDELTVGPVTETALAPYDVFVVPTALSAPISAFSYSEGAAVMSFLGDDNGLWVFHEYNTDPSGVNSLSSLFGVSFNYGMLQDPTDNIEGNPNWPLIHLLETHPITDGVTAYGYYGGDCLDVVDPSEVVATGDDDTQSGDCGPYTPVLAAYEVDGRAVFTGDITTLHPNYYPGELDPDERLLLDNIIMWLADVGQSPVETSTWSVVKALYR